MERLMKGEKPLTKDEEDDFSKFMKKVDNLESIVKDFNSGDVLKQEAAMREADTLLKMEDKITSDRSLINKDAYKKLVPPPTTNAVPTQSMDQEGLLKALEADANQRAKARKKRHYQANLVKDEANGAFNEGKYEEAILLYTEAMTIARDLLPLYTNRAMAYMKTQKYQNCIEDCDFAFKIDDKCLKAFVRKAKALQAMKNYENAKNVFNEILNVYPEKQALVNGYMEVLEAERKVEELETEAKESLDCHVPEAEGISKLIGRISTREDPIHEPSHVRMLYYAGGLRLLYSQLNDDKSRTLFRTEGGFEIMNKKSYLLQCFASNRCLCKEEGEFASCLIVMLKQACDGCLENVHAYLADDTLVEISLKLFNANYSDIIRDDISLFSSFTKDTKIQNAVLAIIDADKLTRCLLSERVHRFHLLDDSVNVLIKYAANAKFQTDIVPAFKELIVSDCTEYLSKVHNSPRKIIPKFVKLLHSFSTNKNLRALMCEDQSLWDATVHCLNHATHVMEPGNYRHDLVLNVLELCCAMLSVKHPLAVSSASKVTSVILPLIKQNDELIMQKSLACLSRCLEKSKESVKCFHSTGGLVFIKKLYKMLMVEETSTRTHSLKILCICGQADTSLLRNIPKIDKRYETMYSLLKRDANEVDKMNQGHAALLLGVLAQLQGGTDPLVDDMEKASQLIQHMLVLCRESSCKTTRYNCVIALGKMARTDSRLLDELRRFDGINILARNKPPESYM